MKNPADIEYDWLLKKIRNKKIEVDNNLYLFTCDNLIFMARGDLLPIFESAIFEGFLDQV